ncbi:MAG: hypothetical protein FJ308_22970 [Planctomycetes bacterium]|nr:hypothetical protein [Planctomycetota bacterium]
MLTVQQHEVMARFIRSNNGGDVEDYLDVSEATTEPLENFDGRNFSGWVDRDSEIIDGFPALFYRDVQAAKGRPRVNLFVVDFGTVRGIYQV